MRRIAVVNHKGGTGKTTTAVHLAAGLASAGRSVLLADLDPQGNVGAWFGLDPDECSMAELAQGRLTAAEALLEVRENLDVIAYEGWTDDAAGTDIQDGGVAASPYGERGGVGPGGIGNYQVTAHRLSSTQAFIDLPDLRNGDVVEVTAAGMRYVYQIVQTRETSFRSEQSLAEQRAPVPGRPGVEPTQAVITLSTCATVEDHAADNFWSDEFGNPEHRIDKIGVLVEAGRVSG